MSALESGWGGVAPAERPSREHPPRLQVLVADDDDELRALLASEVADAVDPIDVLEAEDGAEAVRVGLQQRPAIALLDVNMPRLGGLEVAITLRELCPDMRLALQTAEPLAHRERADDLRLPLFDKLELERAVAWVRRQAQAHTVLAPVAARRARPRTALRCSVCGYGIATVVPPERCPMCHGRATWMHARRGNGG